MNRYWRILSSSALVLDEFRGGFVGKGSPVHFIWGAMDLAVTRFSGARAQTHPGGIPNLPDWITREAYSHELSSAGFWAGGESHPQPIFYSYAYPIPPASRKPWSAREALLAFLESTYVAAAELGRWDRVELEWRPGERPPVGGFGREEGNVEVEEPTTETGDG